MGARILTWGGIVIMRSLLGLLLGLLFICFCLADSEVGADTNNASGEVGPVADRSERAKPKGCKNPFKKKTKWYKKGKKIFKNCQKWTCTEPKRRVFTWVTELDTRRCCSFNQTYYPIDTDILCKELEDECTTVCLECVEKESVATLDLVVEDDCPTPPPVTHVVQKVPYDMKTPNHPGAYPPNKDIRWSITPRCGTKDVRISIFVEFHTFDVLGDDAYVLIDPPIAGKSKFSGNSFNARNAPPKTINFPAGTTVTISFHSGKIVNGHTGFDATITEREKTKMISSPNFPRDLTWEQCRDDVTPPRGYGTDIYHCDLRLPPPGAMLNAEFGQFDVTSPNVGDYLTISYDETNKIYFGDLGGRNAPPAPPRYLDYPQDALVSFCFKTRSSVDYHKGYCAEVWEEGVTTPQPSQTAECNTESYDYDYSSTYAWAGK